MDIFISLDSYLDHDLRDEVETQCNHAGRDPLDILIEIEDMLLD